MSPDEITSLITTVGFPIVMCYLVYRDNQKNNDSLMELIRETTNTMNELVNRIDQLIDKEK